jgi:flap endonuclease GEN
LENGIDPIYILEGKAPELKAQVMKKRREARFGSSQTAIGRTATDNSTGRSRYKYVQQECTELLTALGVVTITSNGEAEAACAGLNYQGAVDGCITVDGDAFLYGAKTVYRNLSTDINNFICQEYSLDIIETRLNLSRDKLVAMAILFGCDYLPDGIPGVGKESALRVITSWENGQALEILKSWQLEKIDENSIPLRPPHCSQCKHPGSLRTHAKSGCLLCKTSCSDGCKPSNKVCHCKWHENEIRYEELSIHEKIYSLKELDLEKIFEEFKNEVHMQRNGGAIRPWQMPCIQTFLNIASKKLKWEPHYAAEKVLPLLSRWVIIHGNSQLQNQLPIIPLRILKKRVKVAFYCL